MNKKLKLFLIGCSLPFIAAILGLGLANLLIHMIKDSYFLYAMLGSTIIFGLTFIWVDSDTDKKIKEEQEQLDFTHFG